MGESTDENEGDRRRSERVAVEIDCQCVDAGFILLGERIVQLSADGALLRAEEPADVGDVVTISFRPPGSTQWIDAEARVTRLVTGTHPGAPALGLELVDIGPFERELLRGTLERHRARTPRVKPRIAFARTRPGRVDQRAIVRVDAAGEPRTSSTTASAARSIEEAVQRLSIVVLE